MKKLLLKSMLLLSALIVGSSSVWADDYELYSGTITEGDYVIYYSGKTLKNTISSNRFTYGTATPSENVIANPSADVIWHIEADGDYWTIYDASVEKYAGGNGTKNQGALIASVTDNARWTVTGTSTYEFVNKGNTASNVNANLRNNGTSGWACYSTSTGGALHLYKKVEDAGVVTTVAINTTGITHTNKYYGTNAGTLTATVTYGSPAAAVPGAAVTWSSSNTSVATVGEDTGIVTLVAEGKTTITASYAGKKDEYKSSYKEYELTVTNENPNAITLWSEDFSSYSKDGVPSGGTYSYVCHNGGSDTKIYEEVYAGGTSPELLVGKTSGYFQATIPLENIKGDLQLKYITNAKSLTISTSTEGVSISGAASFNTLGEHTVTFTGVTTDMTSITIKFTPSGDNVRLDNIVLKGSKVVPITPAHAKITYVTPYKMDFSDIEGLKAYVATDADGNGVQMTRVETAVPENTPLLLIGTKDTEYQVPVVLSATAPATNYLVKGDGTTVFDGTTPDYILYSDGKFYQIGSGTVATNKAYLHLDSAPARALDIVFDDETTGIKENNRETIANNQFFDLSGRKVAQPTKGLYIVNGKKVVIK